MMDAASILFSSPETSESLFLSLSMPVLHLYMESRKDLTSCSLPEYLRISSLSLTSSAATESVSNFDGSAAGVSSQSFFNSSASDTDFLTGMLSNSRTYTSTLSLEQDLLDAKIEYLPSAVLMKRKSSYGDEYGKPRFSGIPQSPSASSQLET